MTDQPYTTDIAFTPAVKAMQERLGSRQQMDVMSQHRGFQTTITDDLAAFIATRDSFYLATASQDGQPYIQHRGGLAGFLQIVDRKTLLFDDYPGNRQYISYGNLSENDRVHLFLMDYETSSRIKIWGRARAIVEGAHRKIEVRVEAWDANCPKHIPKLHSEQTVARAVEKLTARVAELELQLAAL